MQDGVALFEALGQAADAASVRALETFVREGRDEDLARPNALRFAADRGLDEDAAIATPLHAARLGLLEMSWTVATDAVVSHSRAADPLASRHIAVQAQQRSRRGLADRVPVFAFRWPPSPMEKVLRMIRACRRLPAALLASALLALLASPLRAQEAPTLATLAAGPHRSPANVARDPFRHPVEDLAFFGIGPSSTVVEILPGAGGYWTEILAPYLKAHGRYVAANGPRDSTSDETRRDNAGFDAKVAADPAHYAKVETAEFLPGQRDLGPAGSADAVLTFRNVHNWMANGTADAAFASFYRVLKPGGLLGLEEHRGRPDAPQDPLAKSGYVRQDVVVALAEKAGFRLRAASEINANPKDTKDYPAGVWTLPPSYRLKDQDRAKYQAIGESDRMLLAFEKPAAPQ